MNINDMSIQLTESGFNVLYDCAVIRNAEVNCNIGTIRFTYWDGTSVYVDVSKFVEMQTGYNRQFGITLTDDGKLFFVQSWEKGLFCFHVQTGMLLWHNSQKKAYRLASKGDIVLCQHFGQCISAFDGRTGAIIRKYPLTTGTTFKPLSQGYYLIGPKRGSYEIIDYNLERRAKIPIAKLNPNAMDTFIIQEASLYKNGITVSGVEYMGEAFRASIKSGESDAFMKMSRFERQIPVCFQ